MTQESALIFGRLHRLVGLVTEPRGGASGPTVIAPTVILLNAGLIHRIGPRRIHVTLARRLAAEGLRVLRMDLSGIGDSESRKDRLSAVEGVLEDVREAMDALAQRYQAREFVLFGICSGAKIAFKVALRDARVVGAALVDPGDFGQNVETSPASGDSAFVQHYVRHYWRNVFSKRLSRKRLLGWVTGKANYRYACKVLSTQVRGIFKVREKQETRNELIAQIDALAAREVRLQLLYGDQGASLVFFEMMLQKALGRPALAGRVTAQVLPETNHNFVTLQSQAGLLRSIHDWVRPWVVAARRLPLEAVPDGSAAEAVTVSGSRGADG